MLPDDVIAADKPCLQQMIEAYEETGGNMVAAMEVPPEKTSSYGVLDVGSNVGTVVRAKGMIEKPKPEEAPSNLAVIGRYVLGPSVLYNLNKLKAGSGGEIQLTDAIAEDIINGVPVFGYKFEGQRFDCGSKSGFLQATVAFALARDDLSGDLSEYLHDIVATGKAAQ
jgi:UTP--glucose-1-phosphate uridylyltransferase